MRKAAPYPSDTAAEVEILDDVSPDEEIDTEAVANDLEQELESDFDEDENLALGEGRPVGCLPQAPAVCPHRPGGVTVCISTCAR